MSAFKDAIVERDDAGHIRQLNHLDHPFRGPHPPSAPEVSALATAASDDQITARQLADLYLQEAIPFMDLNPKMLSGITDGIAAGENADDAERLVFQEESSIFGNTAVAYAQTIHGIQVWESGIAVQVQDEEMQVIGLQNTMQTGIEPIIATDDAKFRDDKIDEDMLRTLMGFGVNDGIKITHKEKFIYTYTPSHRIQTTPRGPMDEGSASFGFPLPPVSGEITDGAAYLVTAVQFTRTNLHSGEEGWLAMIEPTYGSVLFLRSLNGCCMEVTVSPDDDAAVPESYDAHGMATNVMGEKQVAFFEIGDTLGRPIVDRDGELRKIELLPGVLDILADSSELGVQLGLISNPGPFDPNLIRSLLHDTGAMAHIEDDLVLFGAKDNVTIFQTAAAVASVTPEECVFIGESAAERLMAQSAGFSAVASPVEVFAAIDPNVPRGFVFLRDPPTKNGLAAPAPNGATQILDNYRDLVALTRLTPPPAGQMQTLSGEFVRLENIEAPHPVIPNSPMPGDFRFTVNSNDFGAVSAYHNCDRLFQTLTDFEIDVGHYFDGSTFPLPVDHRVQYNGTANIVNASAPGDAFPARSRGFRFALAARNTAVGMAADWRVVLHEFGHALLWDNIGSPNFRFAHSAGDALAAILNDPGNQADRRLTFPWVGVNRSHMRSVNDFAWHGRRYDPFGSSDLAGYVAEQILSSTLFRLYRAAGGDATSRQEQEAAASYVVFLIFKAIRLMSRFNNPPNPEGFANLMMQADSGTFSYKGVPRQAGVLRKAIRWAFELQGAFRPPAASLAIATDQVGSPPEVDVYVNDGRDGHYHYAADPNATDVWNRQTDDGGVVHQDPVLGQENFLFVRVSNRGLSQATNLSVQGFQSSLVENQIWPTDWMPLETPVVQSAAGIPEGSELIVGPFRWTPITETPSVLFSATATNDASNLGLFSIVNPIDTTQLARLDNNTVIRNMQTASHSLIAGAGFAHGDSGSA